MILRSSIFLQNMYKKKDRRGSPLNSLFDIPRLNDSVGQACWVFDIQSSSPSPPEPVVPVGVEH